MSTCQVFASWPAGYPAEHYQPRPDLAAAFAAQAGERWLPTPYPLDAESEAALTAHRDEGLMLALDEYALAWPDRLPILVNHVGAEIAELQVDRRGDVFEAFAELDESTVAKFARYPHVSPYIQYQRAHVIETVAGRYVEVTQAEIVELSAVDDPGLPGTVLFCGKPGDRWVPAATVERFARLQEDRLTIAFKGPVEVW